MVKSSLKSSGSKTISTSVNNHLALFLHWEKNVLSNDIILKICENVNKSNVWNISSKYSYTSNFRPILDQIDIQLVFHFFQGITLEIKYKWLSHYTSLFFFFPFFFFFQTCKIWLFSLLTCYIRNKCSELSNRPGKKS